MDLVKLKWHNHQSIFPKIFDNLLRSSDFVDVTISCEGRSLKAHRLVLSACSPYFHNLFVENPCQHPIIILKDFRYNEVQAILEFMYRGEISIKPEGIKEFLRTAKSLEVRGLDGCDTDAQPSPSHQSEEEMKEITYNKPSTSELPNPSRRDQIITYNQPKQSIFTNQSKINTVTPLAKEVRTTKLNQSNLYAPVASTSPIPYRYFTQTFENARKSTKEVRTSTPQFSIASDPSVISTSSSPVSFIPFAQTPENSGTSKELVKTEKSSQPSLSSGTSLGISSPIPSYQSSENTGTSPKTLPKDDPSKMDVMETESYTLVLEDYPEFIDLEKEMEKSELEKTQLSPLNSLTGPCPSQADVDKSSSKKSFKRSGLWNYFREFDRSDRRVLCCLCGKMICRAKMNATNPYFSNQPMAAHLVRLHPREYMKYKSVSNLNPGQVSLYHSHFNVFV